MAMTVESACICSPVNFHAFCWFVYGGSLVFTGNCSCRCWGNRFGSLIAYFCWS